MSRKRAASLLYVIIYIAVNLASQVLAIAIIPLFTAAYKYFQKYLDKTEIINEIINGIKAQNMDTATVILLSSAIALLLFRGIIFARRIKPGAYIRTKRIKFTDILAAAFLAFGLYVAAGIISSLPVFRPYIDEYNSVMDIIMTGSVWYLLFAVGVAAPIFEEIMYRALILGELSRSFGFFWANLIHSIVFGIMHGNVIQGFYAAMIGFVLGYVYRKSDSIYSVMLVHIFFNAGNVLSAGLAGADVVLPYYPILGAASLLVGWTILNKK